jgi:hypothetical protein
MNYLRKQSNNNEKYTEKDHRYWLATNGNRRNNEKGYALVSRFLPAQYCDELIDKYANSDLSR